MYIVFVVTPGIVIFQTFTSYLANLSRAFLEDTWFQIPPSSRLEWEVSKLMLWLMGEGELRKIA